MMGHRAGWKVYLEGKMENIQHSNYTTWKQKRVQISFSENLTGCQSLLKMPFIIITERN